MHLSKLLTALSLLAFAGCSAKHELNPAACRARPTRIGVGTTFNLCPTIESLDVSPTSAIVGTDIELTAATNDPDDTALSFSWTVSSGSVADARAPTTTYRCASPGVSTIEFTVSDGKCEDKETVAVSCTPCPGDAAACDGSAR